MPAVDNMRTAVTGYLKPLLPTSWRIVPYVTNLDSISQPVAMLKLQSVEKHPQAPKTERIVTYVLTVIEPKTAPGPADDALDTNLIRLLDAIDDVPGLIWSKAERVIAQDSNPAFDITLTFHHTKGA